MSSTGWFELGKSVQGHYHFVLKSGNAQVILVSQEYKSRGAAHEGIEAVRACAHADAHYSRKTSANGKPFFDLKAANHEVIGTSQLYADDASRDEGIAAVKAHGATHTVKDHTEHEAAHHEGHAAAHKTAAKTTHKAEHNAAHKTVHKAAAKTAAHKTAAKR